MERKHIRNLHLQYYYKTGRIRVSAPPRVSDQAIRVFVMDKQGWIRQQMKRAAAVPPVPEPEYLSGEYHWLEGTRYLLEVLENAPFNRICLSAESRLTLWLKGSPDRALRQRLFMNWLNARLEYRVEACLNVWLPRMGLGLQGWQLRHMKTRWGTCNITHRRITLSLELARRSDSCLEYIVVHELVHLLVPKHGAEFDTCLQGWLPDWRQRERELRLPLDVLAARRAQAARDNGPPSITTEEDKKYETQTPI